MSKKKVVFCIIVAFILGMGAASGETKTETIVAENECKYQSYDEIVQTDTKLIDLLAEGMGLAGDGFQAIADGDIDELIRVTDEVDEMTPTIGALRTKRDTLIEQLND